MTTAPRLATLAAMCNLYRLDSKAKAIADIFNADPGKDPWDGDYVAPGKFAPVVVMGKEGRRLVPRLWGVPPPPKIAQADAAAGRASRGVTNVRNLDSPFWVGTLRHTDYRCLVPVTSFMEWGGNQRRADAALVYRPRRTRLRRRRHLAR